MSGRLTATIVLVVVATVWSGASAEAAPGNGGGVGAGGTVGDVITAGVTYRTGGNGGGEGSGCSWERVDGTFGTAENGLTSFPIVKNGINHILWLSKCPDGSSNWYLVPETTPQ